MASALAEMHRRFVVLPLGVPTGRPIAAQGSALGLPSKDIRALKGRPSSAASDSPPPPRHGAWRTKRPTQIIHPSGAWPYGVMGEVTPSPSPPVRYTAATSLRPQCSLPYLATETDLEQWLAALRKTAQSEVEKGNRISL